MHRRKIQLIAGTTYSISLPKEWVRENKLKEKDEVLIYEKSDRSLVLLSERMEKKDIGEVKIDVDEYPGMDLAQILFPLYYMGVEKIILVSKKEIPKAVKSNVRKTLQYMSGTEMTYEDKKKIEIQVLLDKSRINVHQILYRINLIIDASIQNLLGKLDISEIRINEDEVDRLYQLIAKIIPLSLKDTDVLHSSKINSEVLITSYLLIAKKLENIQDNVHKLAEYMKKNKIKLKEEGKILEILREEIDRSVKYPLKERRELFKKDTELLEKVNENLFKIKDVRIMNFIENISRYVRDIEEEMGNMAFYKKMIRENLL